MALEGFPVPFLSFQRFMSLLLHFKASCLCFVEGAGFEPAMSYAFFAAYTWHCPFSSLFQVGAFDHSAILPFPFSVLRYLRSILPYFTCRLLMRPSSIIS